MIRPYIMSPELITAIKERIALGRSREEIESEVVATGYTSEQFAKAYEAATLPGTTTPVSSNLAPGTGYYARTISGTLISIKDLLSAAFTLAWQEKALFLKLTAGVALLSVGIGAIIILGSALFPLSDELAPLVVGGSTFLAALVVFTTAPMILIRAVLKRKEGQLLRVHTEWTLRHLLEIGLYVLISMVLVLTGLILFIIPGLILSIYLSLALFFYLDGKSSVLDALVQATASVYGRFWAIFGRLFILGLVVGALSQLAMVLSMVTFILAPLVMVLVMLASYHIQYCGMVVLYESVTAIPVAESLPIKETTLRTLYKVVGIVGSLVLIVVCVALVTVFSQYFDPATLFS